MTSFADDIDLDRVRRALAASSDHAEPNPDDRLASVAAVLRSGPANGTEVLLIRRASHEDDPWSGHMAFPGGRHDPSDPDLLYTAVRETREELGLDLERAGSLIGRLPLLPAIARGRRVGLTIAPFVFSLESDAPLTPNYEVAEAIWAPLGPMLRGEIATTLPYRMGEELLDMPAFDVNGRIVWGLTYRMLQSLFEEVARVKGG